MAVDRTSGSLDWPSAAVRGLLQEALVGGLNFM